MTPRLRKLALAAHLASSVGWLGAVAAFLATAVAGLMSQDTRTVRAAYLAMELTVRLVIVPLAFASLVTGLVSSLGTAWGLLRHYWVVTKLLLTTFAAAVLLLKLESISYLARVAAETDLSGSDLRQARMSLVVHAAGGLLVLLATTALGVYKPRGMTPYGRRRQHDKAPSHVPRWVLVSGSVTVALVLLLVIVHLTGGGRLH